MFREALLAPVRSADAVGTLAVGTVLTVATLAMGSVWAVGVWVSPLGLLLTPLVVLPGAVLRGYSLRVVADAVAGETAAPSFVRWGTLLRAGLRSYLLTAAYLLPGTVVALGLLVVGGLTVTSLPDTAGDVAAVGTLVAAGGVAAAWLLLAVAVLPAARATLAVKGRLRAALAVHRVLARVISARYLLALAGAGLVVLAALLVGVPLAIVAVGVVVLFYARVVVAGLVGRALAPSLTNGDGTMVDGADGVDDAEPRVDPGETGPVPAAGDDEAPPAVQVGRAVEGVRSDDDDDRSHGADGVADDPERNHDTPAGPDRTGEDAGATR